MMATYLQAVTQAELDSLIAAPDSVNDLDQPDCFTTYYACTLNYLLTGSGYPPSEHPLGGAMHGCGTVDTATLENGSFGTMSPEQCEAILAGLPETMEAAAKSVDSIDDEVMEEEELHELDGMPPEEVQSIIENDFIRLRKFYEEVVDNGYGVVTFTT